MLASGVQQAKCNGMIAFHLGQIMTHHGPGRNSLFYKGEQWITLLQSNAVKHIT